MEKNNKNIPKKLRDIYLKQRYGLVGEHSATKTCHWTRRSLITAGYINCYKHKFYGIPSHRCLQMTPSLGHCTQSCIFCWRSIPETLGVGWEQTRVIENPEDPDSIIDDCLKTHQKALSGFGGNPNVSKKMLEEAKDPLHVAISLEGEPTLYPLLSELVDVFFQRGFKTVFIVTNGTRPETLAKLNTEPSQLYVSICAPDESTYEKTCRPLVNGSWKRVNETLELLESFKCPTVLRHTLVPRLNMKNVEGYARLTEIGNPTYLEPKAAMSVGTARKRFTYHEMAWHSDIKKFAEALSMASGYQILDEHPLSSIVLLGRVEKPIILYE